MLQQVRRQLSSRVLTCACFSTRSFKKGSNVARDSLSSAGKRRKLLIRQYGPAKFCSTLAPRVVHAPSSSAALLVIRNTCQPFCRTQADVEYGTISELISDFARLPSVMASGDVHQMSSTMISDPFRTSSQASHLRNDPTATPPQASNSRPRVSSLNVQPTPSVNGRSISHNDGPHIHWRGAPSEHTQEQHHTTDGNHLIPQESRSEAIPPPSPRLEPTHRSTLSLNGSTANSPSRIKVRDLGHIQSFASEEVLTRSRHPSRHSLRGRMESGQQYEISGMPVTDVIEMVAGLLTKIITTNDRQHENLHRNIPPAEGTTGLSPQATSVLAFHGKNVPSITIASYLSRIHKYCPTTYEVFLSLLIYFDRMTEMVNSGALPGFPGNEPHRRGHSRMPSGASSNGSSETAVNSSPGGAEDDSSPRAPTIVSPPGSDSSGSQDLNIRPSPSIPPALPDSDAYDLSHYFVVDSFNIHRLVIAGVTCASKFFSDVFYTNSRYAKVGGLPLNELNHLELQFLLLNDFRLSVPIVELEAYGTMLVEFYAREVMSQQQQASHMEGLYMETQTPTPP